MNISKISIIVSLLSAPPFLLAQVGGDELVINEILASNRGAFSPPSETTTPDVIELRNLSDSPIDLSGFLLSDDASNPRPWPFPGGTTISANGFLVVICDGSGGARPDFRLSIGGEDLILSNPTGEVISRVNYPRQRPDVSFGRFSDGSFGFFPEVTIGAANAEGSAQATLTSRPSVNLESGFYGAPLEINLEADDPDDVIHFTIDGSPPSTASPVYSGPVTVSETTVLRAVSQRGGQVSESLMRTFLFEEAPALPAVILTTDQEDQEGGNSIFNPYTRFVIDGRVRFDYIEDDGRLEISQYAEFETSGNSSAFVPPLNGKIFARAEFGPRSLNHQFFPEKEERRFERVLLRNSSQDFTEARFRDGIFSHLLGQDDIVELEEEGFRPVVLYLNGRYLGHMNLREDDDAEFARQYISDEEIVDKGFGWIFDYYNLGVDHRANDALEEIRAQITFDTQFIDGLLRGSARLSEGNRFFEFADNPGFRSYLLHDYDLSLGEKGTFTNFDAPFDNLYLTNGFPPTEPGDALWSEIVQANAAFFNLFAPAERWIEKIDAIEAALAPVMPRTIDYYLDDLAGNGITIEQIRDRRGDNFDRFDTVALSMEQWRGYVDEMRTFVNVRYQGVLPAMQARFSLPDLIELQISSNSPERGDVRVHQFRVSAGRETGSYFQGVPLRLKAEAKPGFDFIRWEGLAAGETDAEISVPFNTAGEIRAVFEPSPILAAAAGNVVISEIHYNPAGVDEGGEFLEITNISSSEITLAGVRFTAGVDYLFPTGSTLASGASLTLGPEDYAGNLSNSGERITIAAANGSTIESFSYNDSRLWPAAADGQGHSLTRIRPDLLLNPSLPSSWRASQSEGGTPASLFSTSLVGNSEEEIRAYAFGDQLAGEILQFGEADADSFNLRFRRVLAADDVSISLESSPDLETWTVMPDQNFRSLGTPDGGFTQIETDSISFGDEKRFYRLVANVR